MYITVPFDVIFIYVAYIMEDSVAKSRIGRRYRRFNNYREFYHSVFCLAYLHYFLKHILYDRQYQISVL
jgi:hypothetical protein